MFKPGDIQAMADITHKVSFAVIAGGSVIQYSAVLSAVVEHAVLHAERFAPVKSIAISVEAIQEILRVNPFCPSVAHFLFKGPAGKVEPCPVEIVAFFIQSRFPDKRLP